MSSITRNVILGLSFVGSLLAAPHAQANNYAPVVARTSSTPWVSSREHQVRLGARELAFTETPGGKVSVRGPVDLHGSSADARVAIAGLLAEVKRVVPGLRTMTFVLSPGDQQAYHASLKGNDHDADATAMRETAAYQAIEAHLGLGKVSKVVNAGYLDGVRVTITK